MLDSKGDIDRHCEAHLDRQRLSGGQWAPFSARFTVARTSISSERRLATPHKSANSATLSSTSELYRTRLKVAGEAHGGRGILHLTQVIQTDPWQKSRRLSFAHSRVSLHLCASLQLWFPGPALQGKEKASSSIEKIHTGLQHPIIGTGEMDGDPIYG
uniref:Uncharacterized protein n=1 Tax=Physcomitrium patens TaxID=3218 RepID=A0A7I4AHI9_PHYPA